jgi:hypothetical protein
LPPEGKMTAIFMTKERSLVAEEEYLKEMV